MVVLRIATTAGFVEVGRAIRLRYAQPPTVQVRVEQAKLIEFIAKDLLRVSDDNRAAPVGENGQ